MKYLNTIHNFFKSKKPTKKVKDIIDIINNEYNIKTLSTEINNSIKKYELSFTYNKSVFEINIYENGNTTALYKDTLILLAKYFNFYNGNNITFDKIGPEELKSNTNGSLVMSDYRIYDIEKANKVLNNKASFGFIKVFFIYRGDEPDDIILDAFYFLISKYGFVYDNDDKKITTDIDGDKTIRYIKSI